MLHINPVNEIKYEMAVSFLKKILEKGLITHEEFKAADRYIAEKYKPSCLVV